MQYTRESGTRFDLNFRNLGKELNRVNFDISDNIFTIEEAKRALLDILKMNKVKGGN